MGVVGKLFHEATCRLYHCFLRTGSEVSGNVGGEIDRSTVVGNGVVAELDLFADVFNGCAISCEELHRFDDGTTTNRSNNGRTCADSYLVVEAGDDELNRIL